MSKAIMISIHPEWCEKIAAGLKTIEVRKTRPRIDTPFKCYIYQTKHKWVYSLLRSRFSNFALADRLESAFGMVIGEFICDRISDCDADSEGLFDKATKEYLPESCLDWKTIFLYSKGMLPLFGWHISDLVIYDQPKKINEFVGRTLVWRGYNHVHIFETLDKKPPQNWCYVKEK